MKSPVLGTKVIDVNKENSFGPHSVYIYMVKLITQLFSFTSMVSTKKES